MKAKQKQFRESIRNASESQEGLWRIARWARNRAKGGRTEVSIPTLSYNSQTATTIQEKTALLREYHFPEAPTADLSDIEGYQYPVAVYPLCSRLADKSLGALRTLFTLHRAPNPPQKP
jgi:hypothetical protein